VAGRRRSIPIAVQTKVLELSGRRCALCFGLHHTLRIPQGQIAHLDRNAANAALANLVFLCLHHHNQYDTRPSQAKGFAPREVAGYRDALYAEIRSRQNSTTTNHRLQRKAIPKRDRPTPLPAGGKAVLLLLWEHGEASFAGLTRALGHAPAYVQYVLQKLQAPGFVDYYERLGHGEFFLLTDTGRALLVERKWVATPGARRARTAKPRKTPSRPRSGTSSRSRMSSARNAPHVRRRTADEKRLVALRAAQALNPAPLVFAYAPGTQDDRWVGRMVRQNELRRTRLGYVLTETVEE
jgi:hypothetical protein